MTRRTRTALFIICVFLFLLAAPSIVFYSQGYRFDFNPPAGGKRIVQTGAFYFKALPRSAEVYLNGKLKQKTSIFTGSVLIENLLPKNYEIEIKQDGYYPWQKNLAIKEKQVTEAKNIILFPENPNFTIVATTTNEINNILSEIDVSATSSDKKKLVEFNNYEIWVLFLEAQSDRPQRKAGEKVFLTRFSEKIGDVFWLTNYYLIFNVGNKLKIAEIDDRDRINIIDLPTVPTQAEFPPTTLEKEETSYRNELQSGGGLEIFWSQKDKKLYILSGESLYASEDLLP